MALPKPPYGDKKVASSSEGFISRALTGGRGKSNEIEEMGVDRPDQKINTAFAMDNVKLAMPITTSLKGDSGFAGSESNLKHSLTGSSAVNEEVGAAGPLRHVIIPNH